MAMVIGVRLLVAGGRWAFMRHGGPRPDDVVVEAHHKGFPAHAVGRPVAELHGRLRLAAGGFLTPVLLLDSAAMDYNVRALQGLCDGSGLSLAPHVKTTMSPEIIGRQLDGGAWAVTVATVTQARALRAVGMRRILIANELVDPAAVSWLGERLDGDDGFTGYCYADSEAGVRVLEEALAARGQRRPLPVIVELGRSGGRAGLRDAADAVRLAERIGRSRWLRLAGVGGYEGLIGGSFRPEDLDEVEAYLRAMRDAADEVFALGLHESEGEGGGEEFIVTAGGSAYFELVRDVFDARWRAGRRIRPVLRSGCYVAHDSVAMQHFRELMARRCEPLELRPALELWARVLSRPEPGLAIVDFGKRDTGTDTGMPVPQHIIRCGDTTVAPAPPARVTALNDQHAYLKPVTATRSAPLDLQVGDLVGFGISHACTTFDKWRLIPVVDAERTLIGAARTLF
jgi:D-serine dehydratase